MTPNWTPRLTAWQQGLQNLELYPRRLADLIAAAPSRKLQRRRWESSPRGGSGQAVAGGKRAARASLGGLGGDGTPAQRVVHRTRAEKATPCSHPFGGTPMAKFAVILPAAGQSSRFRDKEKKPFANLDGRAVWLRTAELFVTRDDVVPVPRRRRPGRPGDVPPPLRRQPRVHERPDRRRRRASASSRSPTPWPWSSRRPTSSPSTTPSGPA